MRRQKVNKRRSARQFRKHVSHTKALNVKPHRGGYRL